MPTIPELPGQPSARAGSSSSAAGRPRQRLPAMGLLASKASRSARVCQPRGHFSGRLCAKSKSALPTGDLRPSRGSHFTTFTRKTARLPVKALVKCQREHRRCLHPAPRVFHRAQPIQPGLWIVGRHQSKLHLKKVALLPAAVWFQEGDRHKVA